MFQKISKHLTKAPFNENGQRRILNPQLLSPGAISSLSFVPNGKIVKSFGVTSFSVSGKLTPWDRSMCYLRKKSPIDEVNKLVYHNLFSTMIFERQLEPDVNQLLNFKIQTTRLSEHHLIMDASYELVQVEENTEVPIAITSIRKKKANKKDEVKNERIDVPKRQPGDHVMQIEHIEDEKWKRAYIRRYNEKVWEKRRNSKQEHETA